MVSIETTPSQANIANKNVDSFAHDSVKDSKQPVRQHMYTVASNVYIL